MCDAFMAETYEWNNHHRDPERISKRWISELGADAVAKRYLKIFRSMIKNTTRR
jgi:hypothetical protein